MMFGKTDGDRTNLEDECIKIDFISVDQLKRQGSMFMTACSDEVLF